MIELNNKTAVDTDILNQIINTHVNPDIAEQMLRGVFTMPKLPKRIEMHRRPWHSVDIINYNPLAIKGKEVTARYTKYDSKTIMIQCINGEKEVDSKIALEIYNEWVSLNRPTEIVIKDRKVLDQNTIYTGYDRFTKELDTTYTTGEEQVSLHSILNEFNGGTRIW